MLLTRLTTRVLIELLENLSKMVTDPVTQTELPHIIVGYSNTTTWQDRFDAWCLEIRAWQLSDPNVPRRDTGSAIDQALFLPGHYVPSAFAYEEGEDDGNKGPPGAVCYAATVIPGKAVADHFPLLLSVQCETQEEHFYSRP